MIFDWPFSFQGHFLAYLKELTSVCVKAILGIEWSISPTCLCTAFARKDPKSAKRQSSRQYLFVLLGSSHKKIASKTLVKLTRGCGYVIAMDTVMPQPVINDQLESNLCNNLSY